MKPDEFFRIIEQEESKSYRAMDWVMEHAISIYLIAILIAVIVAAIPFKIPLCK